MINKKQLSELIERTLKEYNLYSKSAHEIVLGTIIYESKRGTYLKQRVKNFDYNKHALGIAQMERKTFRWLAKVYMSKFPFLASVKFEELEYNLKLAILFCRLRYLAVPTPIPKQIFAQARYYKKYYNSYFGKGTVAGYMENFKRYS